jgi:hypothetical protein
MEANKMKAIQKIATLGALVLALSGCGGKQESIEVKDGSFRGYPVHVIDDHVWARQITMTEKGNPTIYVHAQGTHGYKFNTIELNKVREGSPLEKYANLDSLELAYKTIMQQK